MKQVLFLLLISVSYCHCKEKPVDPVATNDTPFVSTPTSAPITPGIIDEASGIADSRINTGAIWVEEDGGNDAAIYLLQYNGSIQKKVNIKGATNRDWEDMTISAGPVAGTNYIYLADIGDNNNQHNNYTIYRFPEPAATTDDVTNWTALQFAYPDSAHDAEAFLVDNETKDIYIITKRDAVSKIYKLAYPQSEAGVTVASYVMDLPFSGAVSAALSKSGSEIIIKTYTGLHYWQRKAGEKLETALAKPALILGYKLEPQGEAVCFKSDDSGFFTLSERAIFPSVSLNFYKRK